MDIKVNDWQKFFTEFKNFNAESLRQRVAVTNGKAAEHFFREFNQIYTPFFRSGGTINVWDIAGIGTDEGRNCAVLGWLLDCHGSHGQGASFLACFLESLKAPGHNAGGMAHLPKPDQVRAPYRTAQEKTYTQEDIENSRVDIVIENESFLLFIEVKIYAGESGNQLERYNAILRSRGCGKSGLLVFLTPSGKTARDDSAGEVACLSWSRLADAFEKFINARGVSGGHPASPQQPFLAALVQQFCNHIRQF